MYRKNLPLGVRILLAIVSVALCFCLFAATLGTIVLADLGIVISEDGVQTIVTHLLFPSAAPQRMPHTVRPNLALGAHLSGAETPALGDFNITDMLFDFLEEQFGEELPVTKDQVDSLLQNPSVSDLVTDKFSGIVNDLINGENTTTVTKDEIIHIATEHKDFLEETFDIVIEEEVIDQFLEENNVMEYVENAFSQITEFVGGTTDPEAPTLSDQEILENMVNKGEFSPAALPAIMRTLRSATALPAVLAAIGACLLLIALLFLTHWGRPFAAVRTAGIPVFLAGLTMLLPSIAASIIPVSGAEAVVLNIVKGLLASVIGVSIAVAALGLVMIVAGATLNSIFRKKYKRALAAAAAPVVAEAVVEEAPTPVAAEETPVEEPAAE